jgi:hypothetical protein
LERNMICKRFFLLLNKLDSFDYSYFLFDFFIGKPE